MTTKTKMVSVYSASNADLLAHAVKVLGLPVDENTPHKTLIAKVVEVSQTKEVPVPDVDAGDSPRAASQRPNEDDDDDEIEAEAPRALTADEIAKRDARTVRLIIAKQTGVPGGDEDVPLGVNGSFMVVRRGIQQDVPMPFFRVLEAAVQDIYEPLENGGISAIPNKVPLYPYTVTVPNY